jgi:hypothetical protein
VKWEIFMKLRNAAVKAGHEDLQEVFKALRIDDICCRMRFTTALQFTDFQAGNFAAPGVRHK